MKATPKPASRTSVFLCALLLLAGSSCTSTRNVHWIDETTGKLISANRDSTFLDGNFTPRTPQGMASNFKLGILEFDDLGMLRERKQLLDIQDFLLRRPMKSKPLLLVTYVHGWMHDASPRDSDLLQLKDQLNTAAKTWWKHGEIVGVYVGWRGKTASMDGVGSKSLEKAMTLLRLSSFYGRKKTAARIGGVGGTEALLTLLESAKIVCPQRAKRHILSEDLMVLSKRCWLATASEAASWSTLVCKQWSATRCFQNSPAT